MTDQARETLRMELEWRQHHVAEYEKLSGWERRQKAGRVVHDRAMTEALTVALVALEGQPLLVSLVDAVRGLAAAQTAEQRAAAGAALAEAMEHAGPFVDDLDPPKPFEVQP